MRPTLIPSLQLGKNSECIDLFFVSVRTLLLNRRSVERSRKCGCMKETSRQQEKRSGKSIFIQRFHVYEEMHDIIIFIELFQVD